MNEPEPDVQTPAPLWHRLGRAAGYVLVFATLLFHANAALWRMTAELPDELFVRSLPALGSLLVDGGIGASLLYVIRRRLPERAIEAGQRAIGRRRDQSILDEYDR